MAHCAFEVMPNGEGHSEKTMRLKPEHYEKFLDNCKLKRPLSDKLKRIAHELDTHGF